MATFSGLDFLKHDGLYVRKLLVDINAGKQIKLGTKGESSTVIDPNCPAVKVLMQNINNLAPLKPKFISKPQYQFYIKGTNPTNPETIKWTSIFKGTFSTKGTTVSTEAQETVSCRIMELVLDSKPFDLNVVLKVIPNPDSSWIQHFEKQYEGFKTIKDKFKLHGRYKVSREVPEKSTIQAMLKQFGIQRISAWSPADIWVYKDFSIPGVGGLDEFNSYFLSELESGWIIPISLKKIIGPVKVEIHKNNIIPNTDISDIKVGFNTETKNGKFKTHELKWTFKLGSNKVKGQTRIFSGRPFEPIQIEYSSSELGGHVGKCPKDIVNAVLRKYCGVTLLNPRNVPETFEEFSKSQLSVRLRKISKNYNQSLEDFKQVYSQPTNYIKTYVNAKIQALWLAYLFSKVTPQQLNSMLKELYFGAKKLGQTFAPYVSVTSN